VSALKKMTQQFLKEHVYPSATLIDGNVSHELTYKTIGDLHSTIVRLANELHVMASSQSQQCYHESGRGLALAGYQTDIYDTRNVRFGISADGKDYEDNRKINEVVWDWLNLYSKAAHLCGNVGGEAVKLGRFIARSAFYTSMVANEKDDQAGIYFDYTLLAYVRAMGCVTRMLQRVELLRAKRDVTRIESFEAAQENEEYLLELAEALQAPLPDMVGRPSPVGITHNLIAKACVDKAIEIHKVIEMMFNKIKFVATAMEVTLMQDIETCELEYKAAIPDLRQYLIYNFGQDEEKYVESMIVEYETALAKYEAANGPLVVIKPDSLCAIYEKAEQIEEEVDTSKKVTSVNSFGGMNFVPDDRHAKDSGIPEGTTIQ
jgi:hypothetical protein